MAKKLTTRAPRAWRVTAQSKADGLRREFVVFADTIDGAQELISAHDRNLTLTALTPVEALGLEPLEEAAARADMYRRQLGGVTAARARDRRSRC